MNLKILSLKGILMLAFFFVVVTNGCRTETSSEKQMDVDTVTTDGAWCWFSDPRAVYHEGTKKQTYTGYVTRQGDVVVAAYDHSTGTWQEHVIHPGFEADDHDNPALMVRKDGRLMVCYSGHSHGPMYCVVSKQPGEITAWRPAVTFGEKVTYAVPLACGDSTLLFYRGIGWHPTLVVSTDEGDSWGTPQQFIRGGGARPYTKYVADSKGRVHVAFTHGHPRKESRNRIYYACFDHGLFRRADGTPIKAWRGTDDALDIDRDPLDTVYDASAGKGWIWDIALDDAGRPVMVYAAFPSDTTHTYHYARWNGDQWENHFICEGGSWFPQTPAGATEREPNYSGGLALDHGDASVVYLSRPAEGVFEIFRYHTPDGGVSWHHEAVTSGTAQGTLNVRPFVPRNAPGKEVEVLWMQGTYRHYRDYRTGILFAGK